MKDYEIKDAILKYLKKINEMREADMLHKEVDEIKDVPFEDVLLNIEEMLADGTIKEPDRYKYWYIISPKGRRLLKNGGYTQRDFKEKLADAVNEGEKKREKRLINWDRRREWGLAILALLFGLLNVFQYIKCH